MGWAERPSSFCRDAQIKPLIDDVQKTDGRNDSTTIPPFAMLANSPMRTFSPTGTVDHPTAKMLTDAIPLLAAAIAKASPGIQFDNAQVTLSLADCQTYADKARAQAVADARRRAESLAHDFGGKVGAGCGSLRYCKVSARLKRRAPKGR